MLGAGGGGGGGGGVEGVSEVVGEEGEEGEDGVEEIWGAGAPAGVGESVGPSSKPEGSASCRFWT